MNLEHLIKHLTQLPSGAQAELPDGSEVDILYFHAGMNRVEFGNSETKTGLDPLPGWVAIDLHQEP